jgi:hypothetical protein
MPVEYILHLATVIAGTSATTKIIGVLVMGTTSAAAAKLGFRLFNITSFSGTVTEEEIKLHDFMQEDRLIGRD